MRITVFGADGFLGRHLVLRLAKMEDVSITAFSHFSTLLREDPSDHPFTQFKNIDIVPGDFLNRDEVAKAVEGADYVFHLVSSTTPAASINDPFIDLDTNVRGSVELLSLCAQHNVKRVIYFSSGGTVYGNIDSDNIEETAHLSPVSPYGIGKVTIEHYLEYFLQTHGLDYLTYRIANPYGPGQKIKGKQGVIPIFMHRFLENQPIMIFGDGEMVRDYIYIDDLVDMISASFDKDAQYRTYNLGSGQGTSVNTLVDVLARKSQITPKIEHNDTPPTFVNRVVLNIDRFVNEFHITPKVSFEEGIERTWDYVKRIS
jgi:UDP-glucose 4-epimerase